ncbi:MAG: hypothetical protein HQ514_15925, partial [Rhodospirillales bacterium]|nr:hypothetical protein [Rhodospirillales bacterium]
MTSPTPRELARGFPTLPPIFDFSDPIETLRSIHDAVQLHAQGKFNVEIIEAVELGEQRELGLDCGTNCSEFIEPFINNSIGTFQTEYSS